MRKNLHACGAQRGSRQTANAKALRNTARTPVWLEGMNKEKVVGDYFRRIAGDQMVQGYEAMLKLGAMVKIPTWKSQ